MTAAGQPTATSTSHLVTGMTTGTPRHFRIRAKASSGSGYTDSPWSATIPHTPNTVQLQEVAGLTATNPSSNADTTMSLSWTAPSPLTGIANFELQRCANSACSSPTSVTPAAGATSQSITGLTASTTYHFRIQAKATTNSGYTDSPWSATVSRATSATTVVGGNELPVVAGLEVKVPTGSGGSAQTGVRVEWTAPTDTSEIEDYQIQRCSATQGSSCTFTPGVTPITLTPAPTPPATHYEKLTAELFSGTTYEFRIRARPTTASGKTASQWSTVVTYRSTAANTLNTPTNLAVTTTAGTGGTFNASFTWTSGEAANTNIVSFFRILYCDAPATAGTQCTTSTDVTTSAFGFPRGDETTHTANGITPYANNACYFQIRAIKGSGTGKSDSAYSATVSCTLP